MKSLIDRLRRQPWLTREVWGWALFDFANQSFSIVILTAMFQLYFTQVVVPGETMPFMAADSSVMESFGDSTMVPAALANDSSEPQLDHSRGERLWALAGMTSELLIIFLSPLLGALADFSGAKKLLLTITYIGCVLFTASLGLVAPGSVAWGMALFIIAYAFFGSGENFLSAFLPEIAKPADMSRVSAFSYAVAYSGALVSLGGAVVIIYLFKDPTGATAPLGFRLTAAWAALFFLAGGMPMCFWLKERKTREPMPPGQTILTVGFHRLGQTFGEIARYRMLFRYLAIMTFFYAGMQIVFWFSATITSKHFEFTDGKTGLFMMQVTVTSILGAVLTGRYQDRIGTRATLMVLLAFWTATILTASAARSEWVFWLVGNAVGLGLGGMGTASRVMCGLFSPPHKAGEFFGFFGLANKLSAFIGLGTIAIVRSIVPRGEFGLVIASSAIFFAGGFFLMFLVDERAGRIAALRSERGFQRGQRLVLRGHGPAEHDPKPLPIPVVAEIIRGMGSKDEPTQPPPSGSS
jgi:MFS transporter, UMF1 family